MIKSILSLHTASTPELHAVTFYPEITVFADSYVNLTVKVANNLSLATISMWSKFNGALPKHSYIINYSKDGNNFTSFIIEKVSYYYDGGLYYLNASNLCGSSSISVVITVLRKGEDIASQCSLIHECICMDVSIHWTGLLAWNAGVD